MLAGPGTGKTRVITHRIAHAITQRGIAPEHVLACTFTVAAARELRERLAQLVGESAAARVRACTMHAFGARFISRYRSLLGLPSKTMLLDRVGQRRLLTEVVTRDGLFAEALALGLKHQAVASEAGDAEATEETAASTTGVQSLSTMLARAESAMEAIANAGLLPQEALTQAQSALSRVEGATGAAHYEAALLEAQQTLFLARLNDLFCKERWARGQLVFADLQQLPLLGLTKVSTLAALVRSDVRCILVDEFQDCNPSQVRLLSLLAGPADKHPDVCVVGDDDQGIYAFRGASDRAFDAFEARYPKPRVITLEDNHRSTQAIVKVANHIICRASHRYRPDKTIRSARHDDDSSQSVELLTYEGNAGYISASVALVLRVRDAARAANTDLLSDVAVIARTNKDAAEIAAFLRAHGVACKERGQPSPFEHPAVVATLAWARWLLSDSDGQPVLDVLRSPPWNITPQVASALYNMHRDLQAQLRHAAIATEPLEAATSKSRRPRLGWNAFLSRLVEASSKVPDDEKEAGLFAASQPATTLALPDNIADDREQLIATVRSLLGLHKSLQQSVLALPASQAIEAILHATDPAHAGLPDSREQASRVRALLMLLSVARAKQPLLPAPATLASLLAYLDEMLALDPALKDLRANQVDDDAGEEWRTHDMEFAELDEPRQPDEAGRERSNTRSEGIVQVLTAHASKGLEFGTVIVPRITPPHGYCTAAPRNDDGGLPVGLLACGETALPTSEETAARDADESRRVFYVACTRAKNRLVLLSQKRKGKSKAANHYFQELADASASLPVVLAAASIGLDADPSAPEPTGSANLAAAGLLPRDVVQRKQTLMQQLRAQLARALDWLTSGDAPANHAAPELLIARARALASVDPLAAAKQLGPEHAIFAQALEDALHANVAPRTSAFPLPKGSLQLSYSSIHLYQHCPRCWYVRHVLGMPEATSSPALVGIVTHSALEAFYREWAEQDSEGEHSLTLGRLHALATQRWKDEARLAGAAAQATAPTDLQHIHALLTNCWTKLHKDTDHVLEVELSTTYPVVVDGITHTMVAKIDRVDQAPAAGGFRIIDYKTGHPSKRLLTPEANDLQLGIYALGIAHAYPETDLANCSGEYWLLESAQRGAIRFSDLDMQAIQADIHNVVSSILAGKFLRSKRECDGHCAVLPESVVIGSS